MRLLRSFGSVLSSIATFLLSLILAIIIWVTATQANDPTIIKPLQIPLEIPVPSDAALIEPSTPNLNVTVIVEGPASVLESITRDDFTSSIDLQDVPYGTVQSVPILVQQLGAEATISNYDPQAIEIHLEKLVSREIEVESEVRGDVARGHSMGEIIINPERIMVTGRESVVDALDFAQATIFLNDNRETLVETRPLIFYDAQGQVASVRNLQLSSRDVEVTVPVTEAADFAEKIITVDLDGAPAAGYRVLSVNVEPSTILVQGRPTQLDVLSNIKTEPVDITGLTETFVTPVSLALPDGVEPDEFTEIVVTVEIEPFQSTQTFRRFVEVQGLAEGLEAELSHQSVKVVLFGPSPVLQAIQEDELTVSIDLFGLEEGTYSGLVPDAVFPDRGIELRSIEPAVISATITQEMTSTRGITNTTSLTSTSSIEMEHFETAMQPASDTAVTPPLPNNHLIHKPKEIELL